MTQLTSKYGFNMSGAIVTIGFTADNEIFTEMMFVKKKALLDTVSSIIIKKGALTSKLQLDIKIKKNNKEQIFQVVQIDPADEKGKIFIDELKSKLPKDCSWVDKLETQDSNSNDKFADHNYDLQILYTNHFAGFGRGLQIGMYYGLFGVILLFPLPLLFYSLIAGCHRITTNDQGIKIKKLVGSFIPWEEVANIEASKYDVVSKQYGQEMDRSTLILFHLEKKDGTKKKFITNSLVGKGFVKEMTTRGKISEENMKMFI